MESHHKAFWASTKIVFLNITSWVDISIGAEHYYGSLNKKTPGPGWKDKRVNVQRELSKKEAEELNKKDGSRFRLYEAGDKTDRFKTKEAVIRAAKKQFRKEFPRAKYLMQTPGTLAVAEPQEVLIGPRKTILNDIFFAFDLLEWDKDDKRKNELEQEWEKVLEI